jgi:hypothetical protein
MILEIISSFLVSAIADLLIHFNENQPKISSINNKQQNFTKINNIKSFKSLNLLR